MFASLLPAKTDVRGAYLWHDNTVLDWVNGPLPAPAKVAIVTGSNKGTHVPTILRDTINFDRQQ